MHEVHQILSQLQTREDMAIPVGEMLPAEGQYWLHPGLPEHLPASCWLPEASAQAPLPLTQPVHAAS